MKLTCVRKCYHEGRVWEKGDTFTGKVPTKHFVDENGVPAGPKPAPAPSKK